MSIHYEYSQQLRDLRQRKVPLATFSAPCCGGEISTPKPPPIQSFGTTVHREPWRAEMECPHCGERFHKAVHADGRVDLELATRDAA